VLGTGNAAVEAIAVGRLHDGDDPAGAFGLPYLASRDASHDTKEAGLLQAADRAGHAFPAKAGGAADRVVRRKTAPATR